MKVEDLLVAKVEPVPSVSDRNPDVECEFFHTRQVSHCSRVFKGHKDWNHRATLWVVACLLVMHTTLFLLQVAVAATD